VTQGTGTYFPHRDADWLTTYGGQTEKIELGPDCTDERQQQIFLPLRRLQNGICYVIFLEKRILATAMAIMATEKQQWNGGNQASATHQLILQDHEYGASAYVVCFFTLFSVSIYTA